MSAATANPFLPGNASRPLSEAGKPESLRKAVTRLANAGKCQADIAAELRLPPHIVRRECNRLRGLGLLGEVPLYDVTRRGGALRARLHAGREAAIARAAAGTDRPMVTQDEQALIARFLASRGATKCAPAGAEGARETEYEGW